MVPGTGRGQCSPRQGVRIIYKRLVIFPRRTEKRLSTYSPKRTEKGGVRLYTVCIRYIAVLDKKARISL